MFGAAAPPLAPVFDIRAWRYGDLRLRIRRVPRAPEPPASVVSAVAPALRPRRARGEPTKLVTARPRAGAPNAEWTREITALEAWVDGRGPSPIVTHGKKYRPIAIDWSSLRGEVRAQFDALSQALKLPRIIGEAGAERLVQLNRAYKRWTQGRLSSDELAAEARDVVAFVLAAPRPTPAPDLPDPPRPTFTRAQLGAAYARIGELVAAHTPSGLRADVEEKAHDELLFPSNRVRGAHGFDEWITRAYWRADKAVRARLAIEAPLEDRNAPREAGRRNARATSSRFGPSR
jgi:hypothetical protein